MKAINTIITATVLLSAISCNKTEMQPPSATTNSITNTSLQTPKGIQTAIPAYYDAKIFTILFAQFSSKAAANLIAHNPGINFIYQSDNGLLNNQPFISVIDAIPGDGMNPVWREVQIVFNAGFTPRQLYRDDDVLNAAAGPNPEITLTMTDEVYWCPVISH